MTLSNIACSLSLSVVLALGVSSAGCASDVSDQEPEAPKAAQAEHSDPGGGTTESKIAPQEPTGDPPAVPVTAATARPLGSDREGPYPQPWTARR
jgi:hypothetical protein